ncbi:AAA family ATPase [Paracoccus benzoatiresistens]|uniref:AAA family ATPase n=1 Tax=Paracoccus benzoatiresistens TaxID=2997341 RepID=A0ABT4J1U4_9RHOB|nr:AAA family ATPase [Paracoccus sp. EF6]MCZ0961084.1 AAA family ATPase [Paracoccus sp. EF6]
MLEWMEKGIAARVPLLVLTGEAGTGKTTLLKLLRARHRKDWIMGLIWRFHPRDDDICVQARRALDLPDRRNDSPALSAKRIRRFAAAMRAKDRITVLAVDEAEALAIDDISALASLTAGGPEGGGLTVLLIGKPDLRALLAAPELRDLPIEESACAVLSRFSENDTADYVEHRLRRSGAREPIFDPGAMQVLHAFGQGLPRLINVMADHCLRTAASKNMTRLDAPWVRTVLQQATTIGALSHLRRAPTEVPQSAVPTAPAIRQMPDNDAAPAVSPPVPATVSDTADPQGTPPRQETQTAPAAPAGGPGISRNILEPDARRSALAARVQARHALANPEPHPPQADPGKRRGTWAVAAMAALGMAAGAAFLWLQPDSALAPAATIPARPAADLALKRAVAPASVQGTLPLATAAWHRGIPDLRPVDVTPEPTAEALMKQALEVETRDPAAAVVPYARAAIRGRARAGYYLGQLYETGAGVELSLASARLWYAAASGLPAAGRRLEALPPADASAGSLATPLPIFQALLNNGASEMIWRVPEGVAPARFRLEALGPAGNALPPRQTTVPGAILPFPVSAWRVTAIGADGRESAPSALVRMMPARN